MATSKHAVRPAKQRAKSAKGVNAAAEKPTRPGRQRRVPVGAQRALARSTHVTPAGGNVFADLGFSPGEAENLKVRARLMDEVRRLIAARGLTQAQAGALLGVTQPRVSDLLRGKIGLFTIDALVNMLAHAGVAVTISVEPAAA